MNNILITSNKKKYIKKSFFNYQKPKLLENFKHEILNENLEKSYFLLFDIINSGFFKNIWEIYFTIYTEYIHILNPPILKFIWTNYKRFLEMKSNAKKYHLNLLDSRNSFNFRKILFTILKKIVKTPKKHIGYLIPQSFNNQNKLTSHTPLVNVFQNKNIPNLNILKEVINNQDYKDVEHAMKEFHHYIDYAIHKKMIFDQEKFYAKESCFFWLAKILIIGAEHTNIIGYPYNISLYHSIDPNSKDYFSPAVWHIILLGSKKLGKEFVNHNILLYKIFNSKILQKTKKENFLIIQSILFFFEHILWNHPQITLLQEDYDYLDTLYTENEQPNKPKKPKIKLKSKQIIDNQKNNIEKDIDKIIALRDKEIKDIIPQPPPFNIEALTNKDVEELNYKKKKNKKKKKYDSDDEDPQLPEVFYMFAPPSAKDKKIIREMKQQRKNNNTTTIKPITINAGKKYKGRTRNNSTNIMIHKLIN